ncbi:cryptochrome circadian regulator 5 isoform X3 [Channa argus]|uniref:cryptochrome circadian regulator 5 isoform X3 n=1 Tax=Channa argus TaxID=215402 RepID=UPI00352090B9
MLSNNDFLRKHEPSGNREARFRLVSMAHQCIHWFRKGLRLHDNPALMAALRDCKELYPVFILDPNLYYTTSVGINRWRFLIGALKDLDCSLKKLDSRLFVVRGEPEDVFPELFKKWKITAMTYEYDTEPYSLTRDKKVAALAKEHGVKVVYKISHTLYDIDRIIEENNGKPPLAYKRLQAIVKSLGPPKRPIPAPTMEDMEDVTTPCSEQHEQTYGIPTLEELGRDTAALGEELFPGGEQEALRRLDEHMKRTKKHSLPPVSLHGQLLWREFFYTASVGIPNFNKMESNPVCTQVDWDTNPEYLAAWREARTGFPFIDAIMTQLRQEGWIHHLARHAVACFLTRGDLWISWEEGQKVFEDLLLDGDWALNAGNWQWLSASTFFHQFFRVYSPVAFGKKTDKRGDYIRKYLPFLKKFPAEYIYEPWKAPRSVQQAAGCIVGKDYPRPIVQHEVVSKRNVQRMKVAYAKRSPHPTESPSKSPSKKRGVKRTAPSVIDMLTKKQKKN